MVRYRMEARPPMANSRSSRIAQSKTNIKVDVNVFEKSLKKI